MTLMDAKRHHCKTERGSNEGTVDGGAGRKEAKTEGLGSTSR